MRSLWFHSGVASFSVGVLLRSFFTFGEWTVSFLFLLSFALLLYRLSQRKKYYGEHDAIILASFLLCALGLGILRMHVADMEEGDPVLEARLSRQIAVEGLVVEEPDEREKTTFLTVRLDAFISGGIPKAIAVPTKVLITSGHYPVYSYGDRVRVRGTLELPEDFKTETGRTFKYRPYLGKDSIFYTISSPRVELISRGGGSALFRMLFSVKHAFTGNLQKLIPEPHVALLGGLIIGAKQSLGKKLLTDFKTVGLIHVVVLSGYNITIVADSVMRFFSLFLRRAFSLPLGALSILLFVAMVGAGATAVRAAIMALFAMVAQVTGRTYDCLRALLAAALLMLAHNPKILAFDPSFQLSFLSTIGLILFAPHMEHFVRFIPARWKLRETLVATLATQLFVLPFLLYMTGNFSVVALPANLLVLSVVPLTMLTGFLTGVVSFISTLLALPFAWISFALLAYMLAVVHFFASLSFASVVVPAFPFWILVAMYGMYGFILARRKKLAESSGAKT